MGHNGSRDPPARIDIKAPRRAVDASGAFSQHWFQGVIPLRKNTLPSADTEDSTLLAPAPCLLYTYDAADDLLCVDLGGRRIIKKAYLEAKKNRYWTLVWGWP